MPREHLSANTKKLVIEYSQNKCANSPINPATGCKGYECPFWKFCQGEFDESGYQIDHIVELSIGGTNDITNLQVLCVNCHSVKTKRAQKQKWEYTSQELDDGYCKMEITYPIKKRRRSE
jgi:hypothetical protein